MHSSLSYPLKAESDGYSDGLCRACAPYVPAHRAVSRDPLLRWLVLIAYAQLRLARSCAEDRRLPWERPQLERRLTPCRTLRGFAALLAAVGTPARAPKPCGRSPGRPRGRLSGRAKRYPALKKAA